MNRHSIVPSEHDVASIHREARRGSSTWRVRYRIPGERRQRSKSFPTRKDANLFASELRTAASRGVFVDPGAGKRLLGPYAREVLAGRPDERTTRARDDSVLRTHVLPRFGDRAVGSIAHREVQQWVTELAGRRSAATTREAFRILHLILKTAIRDRLIGHDPCLDVKLPRRFTRSVSTGAFPMLTPDQFTRVLEEVPDRFQVAAALSYGSGLRWGEVAALTVRDIDGLEGGHMAVGVSRTLQEVAGAFVIKPRPKTDAGTRLVPVPGWAAEVVRQHVVTHCRHPSDLLVVNEVGAHVSRGYARLYILRPALVRAGLMGSVDRIGTGRGSWVGRWTDRTGVAHEQIFTTETAAVRAVARAHQPAPSSWHGLRHAYVSGLVTAGLDPVHVALAAGHADPSFTLRTYAHPDVDALDRIRRAQELGPRGSSPTRAGG